MLLFLALVWLAAFAQQGAALRLGRTSSIASRAVASTRLEMGGGPIRADSIPKLIELIKMTDRGLQSGSNDAIKGMIDDIESAQSQYVARDKGFVDKCNGRWELLWTTEKETLFFAKSGLFGSPVTSISQTIDTRAGEINNLISFANNRSFSVLGSVAPDPSTPSKFNFAFVSAELAIPPLPTLRLPPVGSGWFKNVYCNGEFRLSKDVRGDYLVSRRTT